MFDEGDSRRPRNATEAAAQKAASPDTVRLYYYTTKTCGLKILWERRLKIARYQDVSDPFELLPFDRSDKRSRAFWDGQVEQLFSARHGMICFSDDWRNSLMWASYGERHAGVCLGFDVLRDCAAPVAYLDQPLAPRRPTGLTKQGAARAATSLEAIALRYKPGAWRHEREWRVRAPLDRPHDGLYFQAFDDGLHLREVILGPRCPLRPADVVEAVNSPPLDVEIFAARAAYDRFAIERHELLSTHTIEGYRDRLLQAEAVYASAFDDLSED